MQEFLYMCHGEVRDQGIQVFNGILLPPVMPIIPGYFSAARIIRLSGVSTYSGS